MTIKELKELISDMPDHFEIVLEYSDGSVGEFMLESISESCDDPTIVGWIIIPRETRH